MGKEVKTYKPPKRFELDLRCSLCEEKIGRVIVEFTDPDSTIGPMPPKEFIKNWQELALENLDELNAWHSKCEADPRFF